nr:MAG TPA: hypothetical protein [Caudoviricetes sp.]
MYRFIISFNRHNFCRIKSIKEGRMYSISFYFLLSI